MSRRERVGASEIAAILGQDPYRTPQDIWNTKVHDIPFPGNEHTERGNAMEPGILNWWSTLTGFGLRLHPDSTEKHIQFLRGQRDKDCDPRQHPLVHPCGWASATLDGLTADQKLVVEAKCPYIGKDKWDEDSNEHPFHYRIQVIWQIGVAQACGIPVESGELVALPVMFNKKGRPLRFQIQPDPEFFRLALVKAGEFIECVKAGSPLPASFSGNTEAA